MDSKRLRELLLLELDQGRLSADLLLPALRTTQGSTGATTPLRDLHDALFADESDKTGAKLRLARHLETVALGLARESGASGEASPDLEGLFLPSSGAFVRREDALLALGEFMQLAKDRKHAKDSGLRIEVQDAVDEARRSCQQELLTLPVPWTNLDVQELVHAFCARGQGDPESADWLQARMAEQEDSPAAGVEVLAQAYDDAASRADKESALDRMLEHRSDLVIPLLLQRYAEPWARLRIAVALAHRFPERNFVDCQGVHAWLEREQLTPTGLEMVLARTRVNALGAVTSVDFNRRWADKVPSLRPLLRSGGGTVAPLIPPLPKAAAKPAEPTPPKTPTIWDTHLKPFFADNWYVFAGLLMLVVGCSIVAYYTWDRHWLWRYTLLPTMLGVFTFALAGVGSWMEGKSEAFRGTAASLRAAAICLLPINFMTVALFAVDPQIGSRGLSTTIAAAVYLGLFGWGLRRWCRAVFAPMGGMLGGALLLLNALVVLRPLAVSLPTTLIPPEDMPVVIGTGFYLGFFALSAVVLVFGRRYLTKELAEARIVPWFVGGTLVATFLQVMAWVHASLGSLPQAHTYAPMMVMAGGLLLFAERRVQALDSQDNGHRSESFLGFALILLGCLLAQGDELVRVLSFLLAGAAWLYQARGRGHRAHQWIGLILLTFGVASIGMIGGFPPALRPMLGFAMAAGMVWTRAYAERRGDSDLASAAHGMRDAVLVLASIVAVIGQWSQQGAPWIAAGYLGATAVLFAWFAHKEQRLQLLHTAMLLVALMLPYAGCVDLEGRSLHGNTMVFGLAIVAILWLLQNWLAPTRLTRRARSTVLWFYGTLAVVGMVLRVVVERGTPGDVLWYRQVMDYSGPLLMALVLVFATYFSRSLVPAIMAAVIVIILFPELKARFETTFEQLGWGTGVGSAVNALWICALCFALRPWSFLARLGPGDRLFDAYDFPLRRFDHTLFTWPLLASALFLVARTDTWTLYVNLAKGMSPATAWAIVISGAVWTLLAAYWQGTMRSRVALYLGCLAWGAGFFLLHWQVAPTFSWLTPTLWTLLLLQALYTIQVSLLAPRLPWVRTELALPTLGVLRVSTFVVALALIGELAARSSFSDAIWLVAFAAVYLFWDAFHRNNYVAGSLLFLLAFACVPTGVAEAGQGWAQHFSWADNGTPLVLFLLAIQALHLLPDAVDRWWRPSLVLPFQVGSLILIGLLSARFFHGIVYPPELTDTARWLLLLALVLLARAWRVTGFLIVPLSLGYLWLCTAQLGMGPEVFAPWRMASFSVAVVLIHSVGRISWALVPRLVAARRTLFRDLGFTNNWLLGFASGLAILSTLLFLGEGHWRVDEAQIAAPYLGTLTLGAASFLWQRRRLLYATAAVFTIGNIQLVRLLAGSWLLEEGLSEVHLVCLGMGLTLAVVAAIRSLAKDGGIRDGMDRASMALAGMTLLLISTNYLLRHSLADITSWRFVASGVLAYGAALVFRRVARIPGRSSSLRSIVCESAYHFGLAIALWCAALLIPPLRQPELALIALSLPVFWFALRADLTFRRRSPLYRSYRNSALTLGTLVLALYISRAAFQLILFPDTPVQTLHYHTGSPVILLIGLVMLRLHALGSSYWAAFYGGMAVMVGSYFALTSLPVLRPFDHPMAGAAAAILLTHFWTAVTTQRSPLRTAIQELGAITEEVWHSLRTTWGLTLLVATQAFTLFAVFNHGERPEHVAPLIALAATLLFHHGWLRAKAWCFALGAAEILLALHADFVVPSWLDRDYVVWVLLAGYFVGVGLSWSRRQRGRSILPATGFVVLSGLIALQVAHHLPWSTVALWSVTLWTLMSLSIPTASTRALHSWSGHSLVLWLLVPVWLAWWTQVPMVMGSSGQELPDLLATWPTLCALATALATAGFARACAGPLQAQILVRGEDEPCLVHQLLRHCAAQGERIFEVAGATIVVLTGLLQLAHLGRALAPPTFTLFGLLWAALAWGSWSTARSRISRLAFAVMEVCLAALFLLARQQLVLTTDLWSTEADVWSCLVVSVLLVGLERSIQRRAKAFAIPVTVSILVLPALALSLTLIHGLGPNVALMVVGLQSLLFAWLGRDDRESPWHILAVTGFASFVMIIFWSKLELRTLQAYVLPVGMAILCLLQLFRSRIPVVQRNGIRFVTVLAMILSCAWYAILDVRYPVAFNVTLFLTSVAAMLLGGFLRVRMYMILGISGVLLALASTLYHILVGLERGSRMTLVGLLVVLTGAGLVSGAIYYKTHRDRIGARIDALRRRFGAWE